MRLAIVLAVCGCVRSHATVCGDFVCPDDSACVTYSPLGTQFCIGADDTRCTGAADGSLCDDRKGTCYGGGCFPVGCGNGAIDDPSFGRGEQCDDGNRLSHDGCSSACTLEEPAWDRYGPGAPPPISDHAAAYDARRDEIVVFGGHRADNGASLDTWIRSSDGSWEQRAHGPFAPANRWGAAMAYDGKREQAVMFGGSTDPMSQLRDTWVWDGTAWSPRTPAHAPAVREDAAMAYDPIRDVTVMFGGHNAKLDPATDTWLWDGDDWTEGPGGPPLGMQQHAMAFDPVRGEIVMVGETGGRVETWRFDGASWSQAAGAQPPSAHEVALAWDPLGAKLVLSGPGPEQWTWDGDAWSATTPPIVPDGGGGAASASTRTGVVTYGGYPADKGFTSDVASVWRHGGGAWTQETPPPQPPWLTNEGMAYDGDRGRVVMFGGIDFMLTQHVETWELSTAGWQQRAIGGPHPPGGSKQQLVYDAKRHEVVRVGADDQETWAWDGSTWRRGGDLPIQIGSGALASDPAFGVIMFGGYTGPILQPTARMFRWDGAAWTELILASPQARAEAAMAYEPIEKKVILFGGALGGNLDDTWEWDSAAGAWTPLQPTGRPSPRKGAALVWNPARQRLVLFGGAADSWEWDRTLETWVPLAVGGNQPADVTAVATAPDGTVVIVPDELVHGMDVQMWLSRLRWSGPGRLEACSGMDADRDGLAGCDDPDCAAACKLAAERCGDGACGPGESCRLCAADCGACAAMCGDFACDDGESADDCPGDCA